MRAHKADIQTAATKATNIGYLFSLRDICQSTNETQNYFPILCLTISNASTPVATEAFRESISPFIGIDAT